MKKRNPWAIGVPVFYISFVLALIAFLIFTTFHKVELVDENYYDQELKYQDQIDKINRTKLLAEQLKVIPVDKNVIIMFPKQFENKAKSFSVNFFRPSDKKLDFKMKFDKDSAQSKLISHNFQKGLWKVKIDWQVEDSLYFNEEVIFMD